jgi:hypothetical protein
MDWEIQLSMHDGARHFNLAIEGHKKPVPRS